jgi:class 3 adenylate cyclase
LFQCFDAVAKKLDVFKVETVGESYVAVTGLPNPQPDHAVRMARFARECMHRVRTITRGLEVSLGPDTGDLRVRIGLHSGPVTGTYTPLFCCILRCCCLETMKNEPQPTRLLELKKIAPFK